MTSRFSYLWTNANTVDEATRLIQKVLRSGHITNGCKVAQPQIISGRESHGFPRLNEDQVAMAAMASPKPRENNNSTTSRHTPRKVIDNSHFWQISYNPKDVDLSYIVFDPSAYLQSKRFWSSSTVLINSDITSIYRDFKFLTNITWIFKSKWIWKITEMSDVENVVWVYITETIATPSTTIYITHQSRHTNSSSKELLEDNISTSHSTRTAWGCTS